MPTRIDPTINVLQGQLTGAAAKKGAEMIGKWEGDLEKADWRGAKTIHTNLVKLRHHLEGGHLDGMTIAELLIKLGESTERAANHAEKGNVDKLHSLGQALVKAGEGLGGQRGNGADEDEVETASTR